MKAAVAEVEKSEGEVMAGSEPEPRVPRAERVSMIDTGEPHILVLTADEHYAQRLRGMIAPQPFGMTFITQLDGFEAALQRLQRVDLALMDVVSLGGNWQRLLAQLVTRFQQAGYVVVMESGHDRLVEDLFADGVVDCIEKSATVKLTQKRVVNILRLQQLEQENQLLRADQHDKSQKISELQCVIARMERHTERAIKEAEYCIFAQIRSFVMPLLEDIAGQTGGQLSGELLNALRKYINDLTSDLASYLQGCTPLSAQELRVALLVKNGLTSEEIATYLHVSPETIKTHRRNIRRKLRLTSSKQKLSAYLQSLSPLDTLGTEGHDTD